MKKAQITYVKQKLQILSKQDLIEFAKYTNSWFRPYWPKSEIADAIISGQQKMVIPKLKSWAKIVGKEKLLFAPEAEEFWKQDIKDEGETSEELKTFSEEFLERWKKLSTKDEKPPKMEIKLPPKIGAKPKERPTERPKVPEVKPEIETIRERIKERYEDKRAPGKPPTLPPSKFPVRQPPKLEPRKVKEPEVQPTRFTPFRSQLEQLKKRIGERVQDIKDRDLVLKEELLKETEELDRFMKKEFEEKGIAFEEKEPDFLRKERKPDIDKSDFDKHLKEIEEKIKFREIKPPVIRKVEKEPRKKIPGIPIFDRLEAKPSKIKIDELTGKLISPVEEKKEEIELREKFFEKYIKKTKEPEEEEPARELPLITKRIPSIPLSRRREVLAGRVNGRGLINGRGLVNGYAEGRVNGRINGKGLINGIMVDRAAEEDDLLRKSRRIGLIRARFKRRIVATTIVTIVLLTLPILLFMIPVSEHKGIVIDGKFNDWAEAGVIEYTDSSDDQIENQNINLQEFKIVEEDGVISCYLKVSGEIMAGKYVQNGYGMDVARVFIDLDARNDSGYFINNIGADYLFEISGYQNDVSFAEVYQFMPEGQDRLDWNNWQFLAPAPAAVGQSELEIQYWFVHDFNRSTKFYTYYMMKDADGRFDSGDAIISNLKQGSLSIEQTRMDKDILDLDIVDVLQLEFRVFGAPVMISDIDMNIDEKYGDDIFYEPVLPDRLEINPGEVYTFKIQLNTKRIPPGTFIEIGLTGSNMITSTADVVTIIGFPAKYYVGQKPDTIQIDGAFGDWSSINGFIDNNDEVVLNNNINLSQYKFSNDTNSLYFYFEVNGDMMGGAMVPEGAIYFYEQPETIDIDGDGVPDSRDPYPQTAKYTDNDSWSDDFESVISHTNLSSDDTDGDGYRDDLDPDPLDPRIPPIPTPPPPRILHGKDTAVIYIDSDLNPSTGFRFVDVKIGADYKVEITGKYQFLLEKTLYKFTGNNQYIYNWTSIRTIDAAIDPYRLESSVLLSDLNLKPGDGFNLYYMLSDWSAQKDFSNDIFGLKNVGALRVIGEDISPGTRVRNREVIGMLKLTFSTNMPNIKVYSIIPTLNGNFNLSDLQNVIIFNDDGDGIKTNQDIEITRSQIGKTRNNRIELKMGDEFDLIPNEDKLIFIAIETNDTVWSGNTVGLQIKSPMDIETNARTVIGDFPLKSNMFILENTSSRAPKPKPPTITLATVYGGPATVTQGDSNILLLTFSITASNTDAIIDSITLGHTGSGSAADITGVYLVGPMGTLSGSFGTFTFSPITITSGTTVNFDVYVDISLTAAVGRSHGVKVNGVSSANNAKIKGTAKSDGGMKVLAIPEYPFILIPILTIATIYISSSYSIKSNKRKN
jgi:hypothetical protein